MDRYERLFEGEFKGEAYYGKKYKDESAMDELELYIENDGDLYRQQFIPIIKNIKRKIKNGTYDHTKAPKLWSYFVENGAKKYAREFASSQAEWKNIFVKPDRMILSQKLADYYYDAILNGEYDRI